MRKFGKYALLGGVALAMLLAGQAQAGVGSAIVDVFRDAFSSIGALHIAKSERHLKDCKAWCEKDQDCVKCSRKPGCGKDYKQLKGWTGYGKNWYACAVAKNRGAASRLNRDRCESWCKLSEDCVKCSRTVGCGKGYSKMKSWTGYGENWYACAKRRSRGQASKDHKAACLKWCEEHKDKGCVKCSRKVGCGAGYDKMKSWTGYGDNWYACKKRPSRAAAGRSHEEACKAWCADNPSCAKCSTKVGCGKGYKKIKSWTGRGKNWYACKKR